MISRTQVLLDGAHRVAGGQLPDDADERGGPSDECSEFAAAIDLRLECIDREPVAPGAVSRDPHAGRP